MPVRKTGAELEAVPVRVTRRTRARRATLGAARRGSGPFTTCGNGAWTVDRIIGTALLVRRALTGDLRSLMPAVLFGRSYALAA